MIKGANYFFLSYLPIDVPRFGDLTGTLVYLELPLGPSDYFCSSKLKFFFSIAAAFPSFCIYPIFPDL